jgi:hypothetical protein
MGQGLHLEHRNYGTLSIESPASNNWCTMVCLKCCYSEWPTDPYHQRRNYSPQLQVQSWTKHLNHLVTQLSNQPTFRRRKHLNHLVTQLSNQPTFRRRKLLPSDLPYRFTQNTQGMKKKWHNSTSSCKVYYNTWRWPCEKKTWNIAALTSWTSWKCKCCLYFQLVVMDSKWPPPVPSSDVRTMANIRSKLNC